MTKDRQRTKKKATLRRNPEEFGERSKRGKKKRGRKEESERGKPALRALLGISQVAESLTAGQLALALATTAKGTNARRTTRLYCGRRGRLKLRRSWMEATVPGTNGYSTTRNIQLDVRRACLKKKEDESARTTKMDHV